MSPATVQGVRPWAIALAVSFPLLGGIVLAGACVETRRALGEDCLKDDDCLSGVCSQLRCAALPPTIDAAALADVTAGSAVADAAPDAPDAPEAPDANEPPDDAQAPDGDAPAGDEAEETGDGPQSASADASIDGDRSGD
ncbi:MAG TPA: hypothetical protein VN894_09925 [Polyangiaceae bacterium]|nr:hypothetical protein [Polyangiaceae bacterium]